MDAFRLRMSIIMFSVLALEMVAIELAIIAGVAVVQRVYGAILVVDAVAAGAVIVYVWFRRDQSRQTRSVLIAQVAILLIVAIATAQGLHQALR